MSYISDDDRLAMRESFHRLLAQSADEPALRRTMSTPDGIDRALWKQMAELGILGLVIAEEHGGIGGGPLEINAIMEEVGAHLLCGPYLTSSVISASLLGFSDDDALKAELLPKIASGEIIATAAITGETGNWNPEDVTVSASDNMLNGQAHYVLHAELADVFIVAARTNTGLQLFKVNPDTDGLSKKPMNAYDLTVRFSTLTFNNVRAEPLKGSHADAEKAFVKTIELARIALAGEQSGGSKHIFDVTLDYIKNRYQFGRAIGGFQAVKHMAADLYIEVESALTASRQAAAALASDAPDKDILLNLAAWTCADTFTRATHDAIQLHGGIAFTWDHPAHLYFRRARADAFLLGSPDYFREQYLMAQEAVR